MKMRLVAEHEAFGVREPGSPSRLLVEWTNCAWEASITTNPQKPEKENATRWHIKSHGGELVTNHTKPSTEQHGTLKALIIYDEIGCAKRALGILRDASSSFGKQVQWEFKPWSTDVLALPEAAEEALKEALDADLIVLAEVSQDGLLPMLLDWLQCWVDTRVCKDSAIAVTGNKRAPGYSEMRDEVVAFAARHSLKLLIENEPPITVKPFTTVSVPPGIESGLLETSIQLAPAISSAPGSFRGWGINE